MATEANPCIAYNEAVCQSPIVLCTAHLHSTARNRCPPPHDTEHDDHSKARHATVSVTDTIPSGKAGRTAPNAVTDDEGEGLALRVRKVDTDRVVVKDADADADVDTVTLTETVIVPLTDAVDEGVSVVVVV